MSVTKFFVLLIFSLFCFSNLSAQNKFFVGPQFGFSAPSGDYGGTTEDFYAGKKYGMSFGFGLGAEFKMVFASGIFNLHSAVNYSLYHNTGQATSGQGSVDVKGRVFTFAFGPELALPVPESPLKPYLNANLLLSVISGESSFTGVPESVPSGTYSIPAATRFGLGIGFGVQYKFSPKSKYSLDLTLSYNTLNLLGRKFENVSGSSQQRVDSYRSLNDDADPDYSADPNHNVHFINTSRTITIVQANIGFLFGF
jgi:outer membrane protein with beta-barrel domain